MCSQAGRKTAHTWISAFEKLEQAEYEFRIHSDIAFKKSEILNTSGPQFISV